MNIFALLSKGTILTPREQYSQNCVKSVRIWSTILYSSRIIRLQIFCTLEILSITIQLFFHWYCDNFGLKCCSSSAAGDAVLKKLRTWLHTMLLLCAFVKLFYKHRSATNSSKKGKGWNLVEKGIWMLHLDAERQFIFCLHFHFQRR